MKASDIPDDAIYELVAAANSAFGGPAPLMLWHAFRALPQFPEKVVLAKLRQMVNKGRLEGCPCGCRGDFLFPWEDFGGPYDRQDWRARLAQWKQDRIRVRDRDQGR